MTFAVAGAFVEHNVAPAWAVWPVAIFALGLCVTGGSLFLAKHKALKRRNALQEKTQMPDYTKWRWRNFTYDLLALCIFLAAVACGLYQIHGITLTAAAVKPDYVSWANHPLEADGLPFRFAPGQAAAQGERYMPSSCRARSMRL